MSPASSLWLVLNLAVVPSILAQDHKAMIGRPEKAVFRDVQDGLAQMGYTVNKVDSTAGTLVAERAVGTDAITGTLYGELDVQLKAIGDSTSIEIHTVTWKKFIQEASRHRERTPAPAVEADADRLIEALR